MLHLSLQAFFITYLWGIDMRGLLDDAEFKMYFKNLSKQLDRCKGYATKMTLIANYLTAHSGQEIERIFTESQLKQIFSLANKE